MKSFLREKSFSLYLEGKSLRKIAPMVGVHRSTLERWCQEVAWVIRRQRIWDERRKVACAEWLANGVKHKITVGQKMLDIFNLAAAEHLAILNGSIPCTDRRYSAAQLTQLALGVSGVLSIEGQLDGILKLEESHTISEQEVPRPIAPHLRRA